MISIVIVNFNTRDLTLRCLDSIQRHTSGTGFEVVLVDNGSNEESGLAPLGDYGFPVRLIKLPQNTGFGVGNNVGMSFARGDYFLLLNSDTYLIDGSLEQMFRFVNHSRPDVLAPKLIYPDGSPQTNAFPRFRSPWASALDGNELYRAWRRLRGRVVSGPTQQRENPGWFSAACLLISREVHEQTRGFDPDFFLYSEEVEWFENRILPAGFKLELKEEFRVVHTPKGSDRAGLARLQERFSLYLYWYKVSRLAFWSYLSFNLLNLMIALVFWPIQWARSSKRFMSSHLLEWKALRRALAEIPRYGNHFAARPAPLVVRELEKLRWDELAQGSARESF